MNARHTPHLPAPLLAEPAVHRRVARLSVTPSGMDWSGNHASPEQSMDEHLREGRRLRARAQANVLRNLVRGVTRTVRGLTERLQQARAHHRARDQLLAMDPHLLRDIGIERYQIEAVVTGLIDVGNAADILPVHSAKREVAGSGRPRQKQSIPRCGTCPDLAA